MFIKKKEVGPFAFSLEKMKKRGSIIIPVTREKYFRILNLTVKIVRKTRSYATIYIKLVLKLTILSFQVVLCNLIHNLWLLS